MPATRKTRAASKAAEKKEARKVPACKVCGQAATMADQLCNLCAVDQKRTSQPGIAEKLMAPADWSAPTTAPAKPSRSYKVTWAQHGGQFFIVQITNGTTSDYIVRVIGKNTFQVTKLEKDRETTYTIRIGKEPTCGCEAGRHGKECKHVATFLKMRERGEI
jgi:hypothetical protein